MDSVTQSYSTQTEELASTALSLSNSAHHLQTLVARFTLDAEDERGAGSKSAQDRKQS